MGLKLFQVALRRSRYEALVLQRSFSIFDRQFLLKDLDVSKKAKGLAKTGKNQS